MNRARIAALLAGLGGCCALMTVHAWRVAGELERALRNDEIEHLHSAWMSTHGHTLWRDFFEHHGTVLHETLKLLIPEGGAPGMPLLDVQRFAWRAHIVVGLICVLGLLGAAYTAHRLTGRSAIAPIIVLSVLLGRSQLIDIRPDIIGLGLIWVAVPLIILARETGRVAAISVGVGAGLICVASLACPKWPLVTVVLALALLLRLRTIFAANRSHVVFALAAAALIGGAGCVFAFREASLRGFITHVFEVNVASKAWFSTARALTPEMDIPFRYCSWLCKGALAVGVCALVAAATVLPPRGHHGDSHRRGLVWAFALAAAALLEVRFTMPYPRLWGYYYLMWAQALAVIYGCAAWAAGTLIAAAVPSAASRAHAVTAAVCLSLCLVHQAPKILDGGQQPAGERDAAFWRAQSILQRSLAPGDTVWIKADLHPIAVVDDFYYWSNFRDTMPAALQLASRRSGLLPPVGEQDAPPCRLLQGRAPALRFLSAGADDFDVLPTVDACVRRLLEAGLLCRTPVPDVFEVRARNTGGCVSPPRPK